MIEELYNQKILAWANRLVTPTNLANPTSTAEVRGRLCGSTVRVELVVTDGIITEYAHDVRACKLGSAAAAFLQDRIVGCSVDEMRDLSDWIERMLMQGGDTPPGKWRDLDMFLPVRGNRYRAGTVLLPFQAVLRALATR